MLFTNLDTKKNHMEELIEELRLEIVELHRQKDMVLREIHEQRVGNNLVAKDSENIKTELYTIESILVETQKALPLSPTAFFCAPNSSAFLSKNCLANLAVRLAFADRSIGVRQP